MIRLLILPLFFLLGIPIMLVGQFYEIEGKVIDARTLEPISYANVYNLKSGQGTISNQEGYFRLEIGGGAQDSIQITYIGFKTEFIVSPNPNAFHEITLEETDQLLDEVVITPRDDPYLYKLIQACRKAAPRKEATSKAYYTLKSWRGNSQVELIEGFYNVLMRGYNVFLLGLKAGRFAIQPIDNRLFASLESSKAFSKLSLLSPDKSFPLSPLQLSAGKLRKMYYLYLDKKYLNADSDSIYVISYAPKVSTSSTFNGTLWLNTTKGHVVKTTSECSDCLTHPFLPMFSIDDVSDVSMRITRSYQDVNGEPAFNHLDFQYAFDYRSRTDEAHEKTYRVRSQAVLYAYDYGDRFFIPRFDFRGTEASDYRKINALPYNDFFWDNHNEYQLSDQHGENATYYSDPRSITKAVLFDKNPYLKTRAFEHPYVRWSTDRVFFRQARIDSSQVQSTTLFGQSKYNLVAEIFLDINTYRDSTHILTATIFDPYQSYFHPTINDTVHCFINLYFDICEIARRELQASLENADKDQITSVYKDWQVAFRKTQADFLHSVDMGVDRRKMKEWNTYVRDHLGIDNFALFDPYPTDE